MQIGRGGRKTWVYRRNVGGSKRQKRLADFESLSIEEARDQAHDLNKAFDRGENPFNAAKEAEEAKAAAEAEKAALAKPQQKAEKAEPTLRQLFDYYVKMHLTKKNKCIKTHTDNFNRWFKELANRKAKSITNSEIEEFHSDLSVAKPFYGPARKRKRWRCKCAEVNGTKPPCGCYSIKKTYGGPYSANRAVDLGRAIYNKAIGKEFSSKEYSGANPFLKITKCDETERNRRISDSEVKRLEHKFQAAPDWADRRGERKSRTLRDYALLLILTGVRKTCLQKMEWKEIDMDTFNAFEIDFESMNARFNVSQLLKEQERVFVPPIAWTIPAPKMKSKKSYTCLLSLPEIVILKGRQKLLQDNAIISPWVFPGNSRAGHIGIIKTPWTELRAELGLLGDHRLTMHDLRRSLCSGMADAGVSLPLMAGVMAHEDEGTTIKHYAMTGLVKRRMAKEMGQKELFGSSNVIPIKQAVENA